MKKQTNLAVDLLNELKTFWRPPREITVPDWVEENVKLPRFTAGEPGPLRISRTPYTRGPLLALGSPFIEWVVLVWGRQLGKSQGVQYPFLCYAIAEDPGPALALLPTEIKAKYTSRRRIQPMINACDALASQKTTNPDDFTWAEMQFKNMILSMVWGGSETGLTTRPARYLFRDEVDELKKVVGENAVDPMKAIEEVTATFDNRKIIDTSTPTTPEGNIWSELMTCRFVFEYWLPCLSCGGFQVLYWENVKFGEDHDPVVVEENAYYECEFCQARISNMDKIRMLTKGEWRARTTPDPCGQILKNVRANIEETVFLDDILENRKVKKIGFHLPKWYSPFSGGTFGIIAKEFLEADKALRDGFDFAPIRTWRMYNAARPWEEVATSETELELMANKIDLPPLVCPGGTVALTAGVDAGQGGFWCAILAWKRDMSAHLVHYGFMAGDYDNCGLEEMITSWTFEVQGESTIFRLWRIGLDTGGGQYSAADITMTEAAYTWIRKMRKPGLFGTKGMSHVGPRRVRESRVDKMPGDKGALIPGGLVLLEINTGEMKDALWFHARIEEGKPGRFTFHNETEKDYIKHLLAEEKRMQKNGKWEWVIKNRNNHLLDATVIALALADPEFRGGVRVVRAPPKVEQKPQGIPQINPVTGKPRGGWMKGW